MLIVYNKLTGEIVSISGLRSPLGGFVSIAPAEPLEEDQESYFIDETAKIQQIWDAKDNGKEIELVFDEANNPIDIIIKE